MFFTCLILIIPLDLQFYFERTPCLYFCGSLFYNHKLPSSLQACPSHSFVPRTPFDGLMSLLFEIIRRAGDALPVGAGPKQDRSVIIPSITWTTPECRRCWWMAKKEKKEEVDEDNFNKSCSGSRGAKLLR